MKPISVTKSYRVVAILLICFLCLFIAANVASRILIPSALEERVSGLFGVPVRVEKAGINFLTCSFWVRGFAIGNAPGSEEEVFFSFKSMVIDLSFTSLLARQLIFEKIQIEEPMFGLERAASGSLNLRHFKQQFRNRFRPRLKLGRRYFFTGYEVRRFSVQRGAIRFVDRTSSGSPKRRWVRDINFSFSFFSYPPHFADPTPTSFHVSAKTDGIREASLQLLGRGNFVAKKNFHARADLKNFPVRDFNTFFPEFPFIFAEGFMDMKAELNAEDGAFKVTGVVLMDGLRIEDKAAFAKTKTAFGHSRKDVLELFETVGGRPFDFDFEVSGDMKDPAFEWRSSFKKQVFGAIKVALDKVFDRMKDGTLAAVKRGRIGVENPKLDIRKSIEQWFGIQ